MRKRESYGPQRSPFKIILYIVIVVLLLGGIAYLVKYTRAKQATFQEEIQKLGAQETEFVQKKQTVTTETETEEAGTTKKSSTVTAQTDKNAASTDATEEPSSESETESETGSKSQHILLLNGSGKDGMAARWQVKLKKAGYTNVTVASFPGQAIEQTRIYVEKEEEEAKLTDLKEQFSGVEVTTEPFTAEITLEDGSTPKDVDLYIIIGKNDAAE